MKILFLDDMKQRRVAFRQASIGYDVHFAVDAAEAIRLLQEHVFDVVFLDHDLAPEQYIPNTVIVEHPNGSAVARFIVSQEKRPRAVFVHSLNPAGRANIFSILKDHCDCYLGPEHLRQNELWKIELKLLLQLVGLEDIP